MPLDIRKITRKGLLVPGNVFSWQWLLNDRQVASINIQVDFQSMMLSYRMKSTGEVVNQRVQTQTSPATWVDTATGSPALGAPSEWQCCTHQAATFSAGNAVV
ncbi:hypothetical protein [Hydrogenophaga sp.]|uniref:hypothetical protein n=1 Tax=Hydrogenophaga sp. TaxID=1904254 RepID=UPI003F6C407A